ncbi:hypothetical protein ACIOWK_27290 [Pseudomonas protegens]|uniref:hypothetical protein n=1 Tax=Pseudomonas protegens TaxID=380021 RepID=UPI003820F777
MKLVDILARELKEWPEEWHAAEQGNGGRIYKIGTSIWISTQQIAEDQKYAVVTRAEWRAAVDALKAEKEFVPFDFSGPVLDYGPKEWSGEGLPPVGTVCEFAGGTHCPDDPFDKDLKQGDQVTIIAHFKCGDFTLAAFTFDPKNPDRGMVQVEQGNYGCFRPIRTPEQIAAEERDAELNEMIRSIKELRHHSYGVDHLTMLKLHEQVCIDLYAAGYRKLEIVGGEEVKA